jgi:hypothetical protein
VAIKPTFTLSQIVNQLTTSWGFGDTDTRAWHGSSTITYSIPNVTPTNVAGYTPSEGGANLVLMTAHEVATANLAFELWDDVIPESLLNTGSTAANITFDYSSKTQGPDGTYTQSWDKPFSATSNTLTAGQVWIASDWSTNQDATIKNESYGTVTYIHEIGHSLGLSHPGTYNAGSGVTITYANSAVYAQDNRQLTVMSYFGGYNPATGTWAQDGTSISYLYPDTPMVDDVAAMQALYGVDTTTRTDNTVYGFNSTVTGPEAQIYNFSLNTTPIYTIWDAGGTDTIDASGYSGTQFIDLAPGTYSSVDGMNGNIGIAFGTTIEDAIGGAGNDTIVGNSANNVIDGGAGFNTVVYSGKHTDYSVALLSNGWLQVSDLRAGAPDGFDQDHNIQSFQFADGTFASASLLPPMKLYGFHATDSVTGDTFYGVVYDNTNRYGVGSTVTVGPEQLGGHWTYTVDTVQAADAGHQGAFYAGRVYDYFYVDADLGTMSQTSLGYVGFTNGSLDTTFYSGSNYLGSDSDSIRIGSTNYQFGNNGQFVVPELPVMMADTFTAVESVTGDTITGILFDNAGHYTVGSSVTKGPDNLGGTWTYTVTGIAKADAAHQDASFTGFVYDTSYHDVDLNQTVSTVFGSQGLGTGDRTANYSGSNYLGSEGDLVSINNNIYAIASGKYVVPENTVVAPPAMQAVTFRAVESATGDVINGVLFENDGRYTLGSSVNDGPDQAGGSWTYTVTAIAAADAAHQSAAFAGFVYDTSYVDADLGVTFTTVFGSAGLANADHTNNYSGSNYLGSEGDVVIVNNTTVAIASGKYVVPDQASASTSNMTVDTFQAVESVTGDTISGVLFDNTDRYTVGSSVTTGADQLGGTWTYTVTNIAAADAAHQNAALSGFVYDTSYFDVSLSANFATLYGAKGLASGDRTVNYSGSNYLGSEGDVVSVGGTFYAIASGKYVVPQGVSDSSPMATDAPLAGGDGVSSANLALLGNYAAASFATGGGAVAPLTAPAPETSPLIAPPVA